MAPLMEITAAGQDAVERRRRDQAQPEVDEHAIVDVAAFRLIEVLVAEVRQVLEEYGDNLDLADRRDLEAHVDTLEAQKRAHRPQVSVVSTVVAAIVWVVSNAASGVVGDAAFDGVHAAANALFG